MDIFEEEQLYDDDEGLLSGPRLEQNAKPTNSFASYNPQDPLNWYLRSDGSMGRTKKRRLLEDDVWLDSTIERIIDTRESIEKQDDRGYSWSGNGGKREVCPTERIFALPPRSGDWLAVTLPDYKRMYVALEKPTEAGRLNANSTANHQLLSVPYAHLLQQAESINSVRHSSTNDAVPVEANEINLPAAHSDNHLWASKYQPRGYIDLLSDESSNRTLMTWLRLWDRFVFNKANKTANDLTAFFKRTVTYSKSKSEAAIARQNDGAAKPAAEDQWDSAGRPACKMVLLAGAPGVGKTTLAHMAAKICGYHVVEMNASDDRSIEAFENTLKSAMQTSRTLDAKPKPICVIIDEIDGAPLASVRYLIGLSKRGASRKRSFSLNRPIICICNDLYAPSLRDLRRSCLVINVPPLETRRLSQRLLQICANEDIDTELTVMDVLCTKADNDIRSCVNTLQFIKSTTSTIGLQDVSRPDLGVKDYKRSLFDVWAAVFRRSSAKRAYERALQSDIVTGEREDPLNRRVVDVLRTVAACEQEDVMVEGLFENYLTIPFRDKRLEKVNRGLRKILFADKLDRVVNESQRYELYNYRSYVPLAFNLLYAAAAGHPQLKYPSALKRAKSCRDRNETILQTLCDELPSKCRLAIDRSDLINDVLPLLLRIVQPNIRSGCNPQLFTQFEAAAFRKCVDAMCHLNITYRRQQSAQGDVETIFEPPIDEIATFPLSTVSLSSRLADDVRQCVAVEIQRTKRSARKAAAPAKTSCEELESASDKLVAPHSKRAAQSYRVDYKYYEGCDSTVRRLVGLKHFA